MDDWASYRLADLLLFAPRTYHRLVELHNAALWPLQWLLVAAGALIAGLAASGPRRPEALLRRLALPLGLLLLAGIWLGVGIGFHWRRYADINWAAHWFGAAFIAQAVLLSVAAAAWAAAAPSGAPPRRGPAPAVGLVMVGFALLVQPWLGLLEQRSWRQTEWFGAAPDPTAILTLGVLLLSAPAADAAAARWARRSCWPIPLAWCAVGAATSGAMQSPLAPMLPLASLIAIGAALASARRR